jgi:hypothetical protein
LVELIDGLHEKRSALLSEIASAPGREHQARVAALTANPGRLSTNKGAASQPYKIREATAVAERRLVDVEHELHAARAVIAAIDARADAESRADGVRREAERQAREVEAIAESKARGDTGPRPAPPGAVVGIRRTDPEWESARRPSMRGAA